MSELVDVLGDMLKVVGNNIRQTIKKRKVNKYAEKKTK